MAHITSIQAQVQATVDKERASFQQDQDRDDADNLKPWPILSDFALHGIARDVVELACRNSEADPAAVLSTLICRFGIECGASPYLMVGDSRHYARLNAVIVGSSSKARKGTSAQPIIRLLSIIRDNPSDLLDTYMPATYTPGPLSSGEGLIFAVRDPVKKWTVDKRTGVGSWVTEDPGIEDKRLFVLDEELAAALKSTKREGNILSTIIRCAFDSGNIAPLIKHSRTTTTGAHIGIVTHTTIAELHKLLEDTEALNGFANRFLWVCSRRQKLVPLPEPMPFDELLTIQDALFDILQSASKVGRMRLDDRARDRWVTIYPDLSQDHPGLVGCVVNRAEALTMRLAMTYALLDASSTIRDDHLQAALAMWDYCQKSAEYVFAGREGDGMGQRILEALEEGPLYLADVHKLFSNHATKQQIQDSLSELVASGKIVVEKEATGGRSKIKITLEKKAKKAK